MRLYHARAGRTPTAKADPDGSTLRLGGADRGFDFLASRWWTHRKLWETAYTGPMPILDPDLPPDRQPTLRGLALPDDVLQKLYHDNAVKTLGMIGMSF